MLLTDVGLFSHVLALFGFAALAATVLWKAGTRGTGLWLAGAAFATAAWALVFVMTTRDALAWQGWLSPSETLRTSAWLAFLIAVLRPAWQMAKQVRAAFVIASALGSVAALLLLLDTGNIGAAVLMGDRSLAGQLFLILRLAMSVSGLVLVHNLYVNSQSDTRGGVRLLTIGLGGLFLYDLNFYTLAYLLPPASADLFNIRGAVDTITVPLLLLSAREAWAARFYVSRQVVFHTLSFSMIGFYLIAMALLAYGLRLLGGNWGLLLQVSFLFGTVILGMVVLVSERFRAALRVQIAKNFFRYKYDYRKEWLRFIATVSQTGDGAAALHERVIQAVAAVMDSPGGVLMVPDDGALHPVADWQTRRLGLPAEPITGDFGRLITRQFIIDFDDWRAGGSDYEGLACPDWAVGNRRIWLAVPLVHLDSLAGVLILKRTLAPRPLNWEDFDLLRTLGRQAGSYIAESSKQEALDEASKFDEFNRRFAFIMHDIKNLVSQLSLVARNAERHADNPEFRADMVATLQSSVAKMNDLLARLSQAPSSRGEGGRAPVDVALLLAQVVAMKQRAHSALTLALPEGPEQAGAELTGALETPEGLSSPLLVSGDAGRIEQLFLHLVQNAVDASLPGAPISVSAALAEGMVRVVITDAGTGMTARFIRQELFQPFRSTKPDGFGIGAYEAREIARAHGGALEVHSREGEGSVFTVLLPLMSASARLQAEVL
jgi:putative PEP-CTERM system histidine kinase